LRRPPRQPIDLLAETAALLRIAQQAGGVGAFQWWPDTGEMDVTDEYRAIYGLDPSQRVTADLVVGQMHPDDKVLSGPATLEAGGQVGFARFRIRRADTGEERWIARNGEMWHPENDTPRFVGVIYDVTREKRDEDRLRANQATLEASNTQLERTVAERTIERDRMWHVSQDPFVIFDRDFNHLAVSPAFTRILGWTEQEMLRCPPRNLIHPDDLDHAYRVRERLRAGERVSRSENRVLHKDGSWRWFAWTAVPDGDRIYAVARDVTTVKQRVNEIAAANAALKQQIAERERVEATLLKMQRLEAVGQLTAGVAHDFNNLLTVIVGNLGSLARSTDDPAVQRRIAMMEQAAMRGAALTTQLLAFSRRQRLDARVVDLNDTILGMRDLLDSSIGGTVARVIAWTLACSGRSDADRTRDPEPRHQRPRCHGGWRLPDDRNGKSHAGRAGRGHGDGRLRGGLSDRHRHGHDPRGRGESVRALFYHKRGGTRLRAWAGAGVWVCKAIGGRSDLGHRAGAGHNGVGAATAGHGRCQPGGTPDAGGGECWMDWPGAPGAAGG
jgi:PAS domain S-box-containing protein